MHNCGIRTDDLVHTFLTSNHFAASVNASGSLFSLTRIMCKSPGRVTLLPVSDILRGPRRAPCAGHDIAGPGLHLDLPIALVHSKVGIGSGDVAQDCCLIQKQAAAGQLAGCQ